MGPQFIKLANGILGTLERGNIKILTCLDFFTAFYTVDLDHEVMLNVLKDYNGFDGTTLKWFRSFLCIYIIDKCK